MHLECICLQPVAVNARKCVQPLLLNASRPGDIPGYERELLGEGEMCCEGMRKIECKIMIRVQHDGSF